MIVLMVGFLKPVSFNQDTDQHQVLEFYAGAARVSKLASNLGVRVAAMDKNYDTIGDNKKHNNAMDFNTSAGFTFLDFV